MKCDSFPHNNMVWCKKIYEIGPVLPVNEIKNIFSQPQYGLALNMNEIDQDHGPASISLILYNDFLPICLYRISIMSSLIKNSCYGYILVLSLTTIEI